MPGGYARVLVIDDDVRCFDQVRRRLQPEGDLVVGWHQTLRLDEVSDEEFEQTDVVIADSDKQESASLADSVSAVRSRFPAVQFLLLGSSGDDGEQVLMILLESGAKGYLDMNTSADKLAAAVRRLAAGGTWLPPHVLARYVDFMAIIEALPASKMAADPWSTFTMREQRVMLLMVCGRSDKEIAQTLGIHESIVNACLQQLMHRTGAVNRPNLIAVYLYHKLFRSEILETMDHGSAN